MRERLLAKVQRQEGGCNVQDCLSKKRHVSPRGEANSQSKLTQESVAVIRANDNKKTISQMARELHVSRAAVRHAKDGVTWK